MKTKKSKPVLAWHFTRGPMPGVLRDGKPVVVGEKLQHSGELAMCSRGFHASTRLIDALQYAPGGVVHRVQLSGEIIRGDDKIVASRRVVRWSLDVEGLLRVFARQCALSVVDKWSPPEVVVKYLETGDEKIRLAAWGAARDVAWGAAWGAAGGAARDAAWGAAGGAAWGAAWGAARADQNASLTKQAFALHRGEPLVTRLERPKR